MRASRTAERAEPNPMPTNTYAFLPRLGRFIVILGPFVYLPFVVVAVPSHSGPCTLRRLGENYENENVYISLARCALIFPFFSCFVAFSLVLFTVCCKRPGRSVRLASYSVIFLFRRDFFFLWVGARTNANRTQPHGLRPKITSSYVRHDFCPA